MKTGNLYLGYEAPAMSLLNPRAYLIQRLRSEMLGPRGGPRECLPLETDPREEYTTGVLDTCDIDEETPDDSMEGSELELVGETTGGDEDEPDPFLMAADFTPALDPRRMPASIGLSFCIQQTKATTLHLAFSGGRYNKTSSGWQRHPIVCVKEHRLQKGSWDADWTDTEAGLRFVVRSKLSHGNPLDENATWRLSVFLINNGRWQGRGAERVSTLFFQPQIRIKIQDGTLVSLEERDSNWGSSAEDMRYQLLYRDVPVMARGHMCAAVWGAIDPEQLPQSPFSWQEEAGDARFEHADVRTELLPMAAVATPSMEWRGEFGPEPVREAATLAEHCTPELISRSLQPLLDGYQSWIQATGETIQDLPGKFHSAAREHMALCRASLARMAQGLELLKTSPEALLAFCFAQRAIHEQDSWRGAPPLQWRPFQLAFFLQCLQGLTDGDSPDRMLCDLLWFPTGGGKTEAYLGITAYTLALRRLRNPAYDGTGVISRYTLRLLSIQQFRRALKLITACEMLRTQETPRGMGWRPEVCPDLSSWLWGKHRFSAGLWVGGGVTPNRLESLKFPARIAGAIEILREGNGDSEPAQVVECPVCNSLLALSEDTEGAAPRLSVYLRVQGLDASCQPPVQDLCADFFHVHSYEITHQTPSLATLRLDISGPEDTPIKPKTLDDWWSRAARSFGRDCKALSASPSRPGYFIRSAVSGRAARPDWNIEILCPNPACKTASQTWREALPVCIGGGEFQQVHPAFCSEDDPAQGIQVPIPALCVDDQIYAWPPSLIVATVDKFARLAFEPRAATLFGNVEEYHPLEGFCRRGAYRLGSDKGQLPDARSTIQISRLPAPDLILQDELHLIDGPLGSMMGLYETVVEQLCGPSSPKYIASTATVKEAGDQVQSLFCRELSQFPAPGLKASDSFFALIPPPDPLQAKGSGRLYVGYCSPGRGSLTPLVRVWALLLQAAQDLRDQGLADATLDPYWSPVGYFSSIRQLASVAGLWRQYIPQRIQYLGKSAGRELQSPVELSSRVSSQRLPALLTRLDARLPDSVDGVFATSMFGTGVDVSRLSLMLMHGQPKTTSAYIQATGRVGRSSPGLIVTTFSAARPRELDHYEFFTGYHSQLYRGVEPVTVFPFAPRARDRAVGPMCVALLRQMSGVSQEWRDRVQGARRMADELESQEAKDLLQIFEKRAQQQPELRRPDATLLQGEVKEALHTWSQLARTQGDSLRYEEYTMTSTPKDPVVLGDPQHTVAGLPTAFQNAPQSLREVEPTTGFKI